MAERVSVNATFSRGLVALMACLGCAFFGITLYFYGTMLPTVGSMVARTERLPWVLILGIIIGTILCALIIDRYGYKWLLVAGAIGLAVGLAGFISFDSIIILSLATLLIGVGGGIMNSNTIAIISDLYNDSKRGTMLSVLGASYCAGSILWTLLCRLFLYDPTHLIRICAVVILIYALLCAFINFPTKRLDNNEGGFSLSQLKLFRYRLLAITACLLFFEGILEAVSANYTTSYLTSFEGGISVELALTSLIFMTIGMLVGRLTLPICLRVGGNAISLYLFLAITLAGSLIMQIVPRSIIASFIATTFIGFGIGVTAPVIFDYLGRVFKRYSGAAISLVIIVAQIGMMAGNALAGSFFSPWAKGLGLFKVFPIVMCIAVVAVMVIFPFVVKESKVLGERNLDL